MILNTCVCASVICAKHGCQKYPSYSILRQGFAEPAPMQVGCICPPGANRDCENPACPRKNWHAAKEDRT